MPQKRITALADLIEFLHTQGLDAAGLPQTLGAAYDALFSQFPGAVIAALPQLSAPQQVGLQLFYLHQDVPASAARQALGELYDALLAAQILTPADPAVAVSDAPHTNAADTEPAVRCLFDLRQITPVTAAHKPGWVFSDRDTSMDADFIPGNDHVPGIGQASYSLLAATAVEPVDSLLDLGCGSGVLTIALANTARKITATDISQRALDYAAISCALNEVEATLLQGSWFEPVAGKKFDRIVANPPFVIGPPAVHHVYRDSGLALDGATRYLVENVADYLNSGGQAYLLGSWALKENEDEASKLSDWIPDTGVSAWFGQRSRVSVQQYVQTWLEDESLDPRSALGIERAQQWLEYFAAHEITEIVLGFVAIEKLADATEASEVDIRTISSRDSYFGGELFEYFQRASWLRDADIDVVLDSCYQLRPGVSLQSIQEFTHEGFAVSQQYLARHDGIHYQHDCPEHIRAVIAGVAHGTMTLRQVLELFAQSTGISLEEFTQEVLGYFVRFVASGLLIPATSANS